VPEFQICYAFQNEHKFQKTGIAIMTDLRFQPIVRNSLQASAAEAINKEAFPPDEYWSMDSMLRFSEQTGAELTAICVNDAVVGFFLMLCNERCGYVYYLAIDRRFRSQGYGQAALQKLIDRDPKLQITLDFEKPDPKAENADIRCRRKAFYLRSGFHETGRYTILNENLFELVCSGGDLRTEAFEALLPILHEYREGFPAVLV